MTGVTRESILDAARMLEGVVVRTPVESSRVLSELTGQRVLLKCENLQRAGSFKVRGAYVRMARLSEEERRRDRERQQKDMGRCERSHEAHPALPGLIDQ